jgi:hypothetical protein
MKNLLLIITAGLFILTSCSVEETNETIQDEISDTVYILNQIEGVSRQVSSPIGGSQNDIYENTTIGSDGPWEVGTNGQYIPSNNNAMSITWTGTQNPNAIRGHAEFKQIALNYSFKFHMVTECVIVDGNEAIYGGIITEAKGIYADMPNVGIGWHVYFKVFDAGLGLGSTDQISNVILFTSPKSKSLCNEYGPNDPIWAGQGYSDVNAPGFVQVSN